MQSPCSYSISNSAVKLSVLQWNAGGLSQSKKIQIQQSLQKYNIDMFAIMEANLTEDRLKYYLFSGYTMYLLPKFRQVASGILIGVQNKLTADFKVIKTMGESTDKSEIVRIRLWRDETLFKIFALYIPPNSKPDLSNIELSSKTIIIGDMNAHSSRWGYNNLNAAGVEFEDLLDSSPIELIYKSDDPPTYIHYNGSGSSPDLLCVSSDIWAFTKRKVVEDPGSGHRQVLAFVEAHQPSDRFGSSPKKSWNFKKANWGNFEKMTDSLLAIEGFDLTLSPENLVHKLTDTILYCAKACVPRGKIRGYKCFWAPELEQLKLKRDRLRRKAELTKRQSDVVAWRRQAGLVNKAVLQAKRKSFDDFISHIDYKKDSLKVFKFISKIKNQKPSCKKNPISFKNNLLTSDKSIANAFGQSYSLSQRKGKYARKMSRRVNAEWKAFYKTQKDLREPNGDAIFGAPFSVHELELALRRLKMKKSPGEDHIHAEFLRYLGKVAKKTMLNVFNRIWESGRIPAHWRRAIIVPILKKNKDPGQLNSYRPISLTSVLAKTMERLVVNRLNWYLEEYGILAVEQAGFRNNRSTCDQVTKFSQVAKDALDAKNILTAVYVDFKGAYDSVWRDKLYQKLLGIGIRANLFDWIRSFTSQRTCRVKFGDSLSKCFNLQTGLPQGAVSSCTLFNIFINDLVSSLRSIPGINCLLFADDLVIWTQAPKRGAKNIIESRLNRALQALSVWSDENNMTVNLEKSAAQSFSLTHETFRPELLYQDTLIANTDSFTYLGVTFDNKMSWKLHLERIIERVKSRLSILKRLAGCKWGCSRSTLNTTYNAFILPVMKYCCEVIITAPQQVIKKFEVLQNQALRLITGATKSTPIDAMLLLTGNKPFQDIIKEKALILYEKLMRTEDPYWRDYEIKSRQLKTQIGFIQKVLDIKKDLSITGDIQLLLKPRNPLDMINVEVKLDLMETIYKKGDVAPDVLKSLALETIAVRYPSPDWLHIFTDGSQFDRFSGVGAGVFSELFSFYSPAGYIGTAFDGEVAAIRIALKQLLAIQFKKAVLLSDSQAAIQSISSFELPLTSDISQCQELLKDLSLMGKRVALQWVPGHCGLWGNEQADFLAKKGANVLQHPSTAISFRTIKMFLKNLFTSNFRRDLQARTSLKRWSSVCPSLIPDNPRRDAVAVFRLASGHDCLAAHLYRLGILSQPICPLCNSGEVMDRDHLPRCSILRGSSEAARYWEARELLSRL